MRFDSVVKIDESAQLEFAVGVILALCSVMPRLHQGTDNPSGLLCPRGHAVGLGAVDFGELLADAISFASLYESMVVSAFIVFTVIGIGVVDWVRALRQHVLDQELGGTALGFIGQDVGVKLAGKVVNGDKQVFPRPGRRLAFGQGQALGVEMDEFARIGFVVSLGLAFQAFLDGLFHLG